MKKYWPLVAAVAIFISLLFLTLYKSLTLNHGHFVYALDDAYIHMSIAKNFALHGVWGVTRYHFSSSSSSILWTLMLAVLNIVFGVSQYLPLALNIVFSLGSLVIFYRLFNKHISPAQSFLLLFAYIFLLPVMPLIFGGMEHLLQIILVVSLAWSISTKIWNKERLSGIILLIASLAVATRYESLFVIGVYGIILILNRKWKDAAHLFLAGAAPVVIYGLISLSNGWFFLPNSLLLKGTLPSANFSFWINVIRKLVGAPYFLILVFSILFSFYFNLSTQKRTKEFYFSLGFIGTCFLHMLFASTGWFYRYEAYLVMWGLIAFLFLFRGFQNIRYRHIVISLPALLILWTMVPRSIEALKNTPIATNDRLLEHIYPAQFVSRYFNTISVTANDIGALTFFTDADVLDFYGLGDLEPIRYRETAYTKREVAEWTTARLSKIAILQVEWYEVEGRIPDEWVLVAEWRIPSNVVFGDHRIGFFATSPEYVTRLRDDIINFVPTLPSEIKVSIFNP